MKFLKNILKQPIKETLFILGIALIALLLFVSIGLFLGKTAPRDIFPGHQTNYILILGRMFVQDFAFISKLIIELAFVVLIAQIIYRFAKAKR